MNSQDTYKVFIHYQFQQRQQQLLAEQSFTDTNKAVTNSSCQTDDVHFEEHHKTRESTKIFLKDVEGDFLIKERKIISLTERLEEIQRKYDEEKVNSFEKIK